MCSPGHKVLRVVRNLYYLCESRVQRLSTAPLLLIRARIIVCNLALRYLRSTEYENSQGNCIHCRSQGSPNSRIFRTFTTCSEMPGNGSRVLQVIALPGPKAWNSEMLFQYTLYPPAVQYLNLSRAREQECIEMSFIVGDPRRV